LKLAGIEEALHQGAKPVIAGQAKSGNPPACKITEANLSAFLDDAVQRCSAGIGRTKDASNAAPADAGNRNLVLLEYAQYAQMSVATSEAATQRKADPWARAKF